MTKIQRLHIIGAGLSGLSAAVSACQAGLNVTLYEAAPQAGGRFRSFHCPITNAVLDNGTHLLVGANTAMLDFLQQTNSRHLITACSPTIPILRANGKWTKLSMPSNPLRVWQWRWPMGLADFWRILSLRSGNVADFLDDRSSPQQNANRRSRHADLWSSIAVSILNTPPEKADAALLGRVLRKILLGGPLALQPYVFPHGLSAIIQSVTGFLTEKGCDILYQHRLTNLSARGLEFRHTHIPLTAQDRVILALPPPKSLPCQTILNIHYQIPNGTRLKGGQPFVLLCGGPAHWVSLRHTIVTATLSAVQQDDPDLVSRVWAQILPTLIFPFPSETCVPAYRLVRERRATLSHQTEILNQIAGAQFAPLNHHHFPTYQAGDWLSCRWPCTMEAAILSGREAVTKVLENV